MADFLLDAAARHQHFLERFKTGRANEFEKFLKLADRRVRELLLDAGTISDRRRLISVQKQINDALQAIYGEWGDELTGQLVELLDSEAHFEIRTIEKLLQGEIDLVAPSLDQMQAAALSRPFQNAQIRAVFKEFASDEALRVSGAVRQGFFDGATTEQIIRNIRGTKALRFTDGDLHRTNTAARRIARTAVQHFASVARHEVYKANDDIIDAYEWVSTLDSRTSNTCMTLDGQVFNIDQGPLPPAHPNCRSTTLPLIKGEHEPVRRDKTNKRRVEGQQTYGQWLRDQPESFQIEALGKTRADLFRKGGLPVERFTDRKNAPLTLAELRRLNPEAWKRAGLDE